MSKKCNLISIGEINRYILFIFIGSIFYAFLTLLKDESKFFNEENSLHPIIFNITYSLGLSLSIFLLIIYKIYNKRKNDNKLQKTNFIKKQKLEVDVKRKLLWILLVSIIDFIASVLCFNYWVGENSDLNTSTLDILFITLFSHLILKEKLYKHHYLSIITIMILGLLLNLINNKFSYENLKNNYSNIIFIYLSQILFQFVYVLYKYNMIKKYIISYEIMFYQGIIELIFSIITLIITTNIGNLDNFWDYYNNLDTKEIVIFISLIIIQFIYNLSYFIVIEKYSPFYVLLLDALSQLIIYFIYFDVDDPKISILSIIVIIICFLMILIFVEIIELNFFGLSYMTKKNIKLRASYDSDSVDNEDDNETKIYFGDYSIDLNQENLTEMFRIN